MGRVNPTVLIQLLMQYHHYKSGQRVFKFTKNNRMKMHHETDDEITSRRSVLPEETRKMAESAVRSKLITSLNNQLGKVYVAPEMRNIAIPLQMSTAQSGFGVLPAGSRVKIPEGKKIRAFTYWEKVNDIDLSCFGLTKEGYQKEFSWRTMYNNQGQDITFSGDETSGYNGGSEYFDINLELFKARYPEFRYIVFCDNVYSNVAFDNCFCKAGFMMRDDKDSGEVYEPKTINTSFRVSGNTRFNYMFAIDLDRREMVWLNISRDSMAAIAGEESMDFLMYWMDITDVFNVYDLFRYSGTLANIEEASLIVSDYDFGDTGKEQIHSYDYEKILKYIQPRTIEDELPF